MNKNNLKLSILDKIKFLFKKPNLVIVAGLAKECTKEAILTVLKEKLTKKEEFLVLETDFKNKKDFEILKFLAEKSSLTILVITHCEDIPFDRNYFASEKEKIKEIEQFALTLKHPNWLVLNFDDETIREIKDITNLRTLTFGFQENADFFASDIKLNGGTNFKINYRGNIVPFWLDGIFGKEQIYSALAASCVGTIFDLNLVEISQNLKNYKSLPGKMKLINGIKNSKILDDTKDASLFSMIEAIEILGKIPLGKRKIAVLGDVLGIGKYTIEAHETIGEKVAKNADLLFTIGQRAKFIAQGAKEKGMALEKIFQFDNIEECTLKIKEEIKEGDLVLIDGSKEIKMGILVEKLAEKEVIKS